MLFSNQWAITAAGEWIELTDGTFTCDNTGNAKVRMDYQGGEKNGSFFLRNCGFFNENTQYRTKFTREKTNRNPNTEIEFPMLKD